MGPPEPTLRERTRRAVRAELVDAAHRLILERGYDAVTVEQITSAAGISQRSFFRYFPSKEALVVDKFDPFAELIISAFAARPVDEPIWRSLRHAFETMADWMSEQDNAATAGAMQTVIAQNTDLQAGYLLKLQTMQHRLLEHAAATRAAAHPDRTALQAAVGAAVACFTAAFDAHDSGPDRFRLALREAMLSLVAAGDAVEPVESAAAEPTH